MFSFPVSSSCANNIVMKLPVPKSAVSVSHKLTSGTRTAEFKSSEKAWYWNIAKLQGGSEICASVKVKKMVCNAGRLLYAVLRSVKKG